jgi:hypothetical protein
MKVKKKILHIRKQSRIEIPKESLWFFSEDSVEKQSPVIKRKTIRNDRLSILKDDYDRYSGNFSERNKDKEDCTFVVDWQLSDTF